MTWYNRFAQSDGTTIVAYNRSAWDYANRSATFQLDAVQTLANATCAVYMYWGYSSASDGDSSPTIASAKTGEVEVGCPTVPMLQAQLDPFGNSNPVQRFQKTVAEVLDVWIDCRSFLAKRCVPNAGSKRYEELHAVSYSVETNGSAQASMIDQAYTRVLDPGWVRVRVKAGSTGTSYTIIPKITTSLGRVVEARAIMKVTNTNEA